MLDTVSILLQRLTDTIAALAPIDGIALISAEKHAVRIDFNDAATKEQMIVANDALSSFDWSDEANEKYVELQKVNTAQERVDMQIELVAAALYILEQIQIAVPDYKPPTEQAVVDGLKQALEAKKRQAIVVVK